MYPVQAFPLPEAVEEVRRKDYNELCEKNKGANHD